MTTQRSFKRLVRARMERTGERYAAARAALLNAAPAGPAAETPWLATSDDRIRERTGRGWEEWFDALDEWGAADRSHREIARWVAGQLDVVPLAWNAQAVTASYERTRGLREAGQHADGYTATAQRTIGVPVPTAYDAVADSGWAPVELRERSTTRPTTAHYDVADGGGRVHIRIDATPDGRSTVSVQHARLADAAAREAVRAQWRAALLALKAELEAHDA